MPSRRGRRMLKRWRYLGVYGPELMLCVGAAHIGPARQVWWAVWDREARSLDERTRLLLGRGRVAVQPGRVAVQDGDVEIELTVEEGPGVEVVTPDAEAYAWTSKHGTARAHGSVRAGERRWQLDGPAFVDASAGYHPRHTAWLWSAGRGRLADGRGVAWNLVDGIHDSPTASERTIWVEGEPGEPGPVSFDADLREVTFEDGASLRFSPEATRRRNDNLLVFRSRYEQPFGTFRGSLPGGLELTEGYGVMERHDAVW